MELELKTLDKQAVPAALQRAERYRLLNEPEQAESIYRDILRVDPKHQRALRNLVLTLTEQFSRRLGNRVRRAQETVAQLETEYDRLYFNGLVLERLARARLSQRLPRAESVSYDIFRDAMAYYEKAEALSRPDSQDALLRWNSCLRTIKDRGLKTRPEGSFIPLLE